MVASGAGDAAHAQELEQKSELGLLHAESWAGRTTVMVQYWRHVEPLMA